MMRTAIMRTAIMRTAMLRTAMLRTAMLLASLGLALHASGCNPGEVDYFYQEDFETTCEGAPCGWSQVRGPVGAATYGETLPGDHALVLSGEGVVVRGDGQVGHFTVLDTLVLSTVARCDAGSALRYELTFDLNTEGDIDVRSVDVFAPVDFRTATPSTRFTTSGAVGVVGVAGILIFKSGSGTCEIASISIEDLGFGF